MHLARVGIKLAWHISFVLSIRSCVFLSKDAFSLAWLSIKPGGMCQVETAPHYISFNLNFTF